MKFKKYYLALFVVLVTLKLHAQTPNNGTVQGAITRVPDIPAVYSGNTYSVSFGGGKIIPANSFNLGQTGSLSVWFKLASFGKIFLSSYVEFDANTYISVNNSTTIVIQTSAYGTEATFTVPTMSLNTWYNLIITRSGGITHLYLNGTESSSGGIDQGLADFNIDRVGVYHTNAGVYAQFAYDGKLSELRLFNSVLSNADISNLISGAAPATESILHWKMNEASDSTVIDYLSGNGETGNGDSSNDTTWVRSGNNIYYNNGNVGIGTSNPHEKLSVNGTILAKKVKVSILSTDWADYVFNKNYKLPTLEETEKFINLYQHLPGIPSAKEMEINGLDVGTNQALLLKKIEELTLLLISQNKNMEKQNKRIRQLEAKK